MPNIRYVKNSLQHTFMYEARDTYETLMIVNYMELVPADNIIKKLSYKQKLIRPAPVS